MPDETIFQNSFYWKVPFEVGAVDGIQSSITYAFHKTLGWTGVNIEVDPESYEKLSLEKVILPT